MRGIDDIDTLLKERGYAKTGTYDPVYHLRCNKIVIAISERDYSFGLRYDIKAFFYKDPFAGHGKQIELKCVNPDKLYDNIEEIEVGLQITLPTL